MAIFDAIPDKSITLVPPKKSQKQLPSDNYKLRHSNNRNGRNLFEAALFFPIYSIQRSI